MEVFVHGGAQGGIHIALQVIRNLAPHFFEVHSFQVHHGLVPFSKGRRLNQPCSQPAASRSRNISRARNSRVFTDAMEIPSASAVSWMFSCSISRSTKTSRYLRSRVANASASFRRTSFRSRASEGISRQ